MTSEETAFEEADLISLGEKLATLDLTDGERAALGALISDEDVLGYGRHNVIGGIRIGFRAGIRADKSTFGVVSGPIPVPTDTTAGSDPDRPFNF